MGSSGGRPKEAALIKPTITLPSLIFSPSSFFFFLSFNIYLLFYLSTDFKGWLINFFFPLSYQIRTGERREAGEREKEGRLGGEDVIGMMVIAIISGYV